MTVKRWSWCVAGLAAALWLHPAWAADVEGVRLADTVRVSGQPMFLNGAGLRSKFFVKVYVAALYLSERSASPEGVIASRKPRRIELHMLRAMQAAAIHEAMMKGIEDNVPRAEMQRIGPQLARLKQAMSSIGGVNAGDVIEFDFFPGQGSIVRIGGDIKDTIEGDELARALLSIWLGPKPVQDDLKAALMGGS